jgi:SAM-dependent methyltransferase
MLSSLGVALRPADQVLEIGCGVGRLTRVIAARAAHVSAFDVSEKMLELARRHNPQLENVTWIHGDGTSLAGADANAFDACISHVVFQHIPDPEITLGYVREIGRILAPGGWAAFQISNDPGVHRRGLRERVAQQLRARTGRAPKGQVDPRWLGSMVELPRLRDVASGAGMTVERVVGEGTQLCLVLVRAQGA